MTKWLSAINQDLQKLSNFIDYYENQLPEAKRECRITGILEADAAKLPAYFEHRFSQLQEIEAVLRFLEIRRDKIRSKWFKTYQENYNRAMTQREVERYVQGEDEVVTMEELINEVAYLRNRFIAITKAMEQKHWKIADIVKLRVAGMENATID